MVDITVLPLRAILLNNLQIAVEVVTSVPDVGSSKINTDGLKIS